MRLTGEVVTAGLSAPFIVGGLLAVAVAESWSARAAGLVAVAGGSVALASSRWPTRMAAWLFAVVGLLAALQVKP